MISIVIPNYNGEKNLKACLNSIREQVDVTYEIIIIDNASIDSDYEWVKVQPDIMFKQLSRNFGFSKAVNEGIKLSRGEYVLLLNNDTVLEPNFLKEIRQAIEMDHKIFAVSSKMISYQDRSIIDDAGDEYTLLGWTLKCGDGKPVEAYTKPREVFSACAGAALYRKSIFDEIGYFDEHFFAYMEDVDISYRARTYGYKNTYCPTAHVYH
ncbi:MAG: glycosyltransferase family 2 protein, partial [Cellulosilyticum sp.]|nr:glycosyltransferase family 2 protein [Cellulosilyticum sp.]